MKDVIGKGLGDFSDWLDENNRWQYVRYGNTALILGALYVVIRKSRFGFQVRRWNDVEQKDFLNRRRLRGRVIDWDVASGKDVRVRVVHMPPIAWMFGIRSWPFVTFDSPLDFRIFGIEKRGGDKGLGMIDRDVNLELLFMDHGETAIGVGQVKVRRGMFGRSTDLALELIGSGKACFKEDEAPGLFASPKLDDIREMDAYLLALSKADEDWNNNNNNNNKTQASRGGIMKKLVSFF